MSAYPATIILFTTTAALCGLAPPWVFALAGLFQRSNWLLLGALISMSLTTAHTIALSSCSIVLCDLSHCHWTAPKNAILSFFLREARVKVITPSRAGFYKIVPSTNQNINKSNENSPTPLLIYLPDLAKKIPPRSKAQYWATSQVVDAIIYGKTEPNNMLSSLFGRFGASHLLCLSAWHVGVIRRHTAYKPLCFLVLLGLLFALNAPFPLLRAVIAALLPRAQHYNEKIELWSLSWLIALCLSPFAWTTWSFWLSFYYGAVFLYTQPNMLYLRLSNLVWISLWDIGWDPIALLLGSFCEPLFIIILVIGWFSYPLSFMFPEIVNCFWEGIFQFYFDYSFFGFACPSPPLSARVLLLLFVVMQARTEIVLFHFSRKKHIKKNRKDPLNSMILNKIKV